MFTAYTEEVLFFNDTATTEIYTLSLHDALPICPTAAAPHSASHDRRPAPSPWTTASTSTTSTSPSATWCAASPRARSDRKSTRLNSSHANISYAVFCLKKKQITAIHYLPSLPTL